MQLALDENSNDLIKSYSEPAEGIGDPEFDSALGSYGYDVWTSFVTPAMTSLGQLMMLDNSLVVTKHSTLNLGSKIKIVIDIASGVSATKPLSIQVSDETYIITSSGVTEIEFVITDGTEIDVGIYCITGPFVINSCSVTAANPAGVLRVTDGRYTVQLVKNRLLTGFGEWVLDPRLGWLSLNNYEKNPDLFLIELRAKQVILTTPNVKSVEEFDMVLKNRVLTVTFTALTTFGLIDLTVPWGAS